jgi:cytochrome c oxidase assembly protein subunit 15
MKLSPRLAWFRRLARIAAVLCATVVVIGSWVRLTDAGLGCPDWPGCYGHVHPAQAESRIEEINARYPERPFDYTKALNEMVHRYFASSLGLLILAIGAIAWVNRRDPAQPQAAPLLLVPLVIFQGLLGMWTVTLLLKPLVVTSHLVFGMTTLALLGWLSITPERRELKAAERPLRSLTLLALGVLALQIALGGWVSTNYAAPACGQSFPSCQGGFWPNMDFRDAFVLWRGLGIDYEGGVLDHPARVAVHYAHRLWAYVTLLTLYFVALQAWRRGHSGSIRLAGVAVAVAVTLQAAIGMNLIWQGFPLSLGVLHNAGAALTLLCVVALLRSVSPVRMAGTVRMRG